MTTTRRSPDRLFNLLPALYRIADVEHDGQLRALLRLVTTQADVVRDDTQQLWEDFFIETCRRWVVPYIGDLVGNNPLHDLDLTASALEAAELFHDVLEGPDFKPAPAIRLRADVAKTIYYRRRKGTPPMLEELARDVTGWGAHVVEFFTLLDWNQHLEHLRPECHGCPDVRRVDLGDRTGGPWDATTHTVDVRRINEWDGWYNVPNVGFFLWRLNSYRLTRIATRPIAIAGTTWRRTFSPLGQDIPLFSSGLPELGDSRVATELNVEAPIRAAAFFEDFRRLPATGVTAASDYYGDRSDSSLVVRVGGALVPASDVRCTNLNGWSGFAQPAGTTVLVDVTRGRLAIPTGFAPGQTVTVSYFNGFSGDMGGGQYARRKWLSRGVAPIPVTGGGAALQAAIAGRVAAPQTIFRINDSASYLLTTAITLAAGETLSIEAGDGFRPHVRLSGGSMAILTSGAGASLTLGGLLVEGGLLINGDLKVLRVIHTTLVPGRSVEQAALSPPTGPSIVVAPGTTAAPLNTTLDVQIAFSIVGALRLPASVANLYLLDSIVLGIESDGGPIVAAVSDAGHVSGPPAHIERSTLFGSCRFLKLELASESIFTGLVLVDQQQQGCVRFSFVPRGSKTPQQYRCQPALEAEIQKERAQADSVKTGVPLAPGWDVAIEQAVAAWLLPSFESDRYGRPELAQLRRTCVVQMRTGAEDGSEMGAFCVLKQPQRESNLRMRLDEYLPVGLEAGIIYVT